MTTNPWTWHPLDDPGRSVVELDDSLTPVGLALEFKILDRGDHGRSYGVWRLSEKRGSAEGRVDWGGVR